MKNIKLNEVFSLSEIETQAEGFDLNEYGEEYLGEHFIVVKDAESDKVISFVAVSYGVSDGYSYRCVYSDFS